MQAPLALLLLRGSRWFDRRLLARLAADGWTLTPAQTLAFGHIPHEGISPAELSRQLGTSRQAAADLVDGLRQRGLLAVVDDPLRRRGRLVMLTDEGRRLTSAAVEHLAELEAELAASIGWSTLTALREALAGEWITNAGLEPPDRQCHGGAEAAVPDRAGHRRAGRTAPAHGQGAGSRPGRQP